MTDQEIRATALALKEAKTVTLSDLQSYLGKAADLLRGSIDQADFKAFIFPLMFFKRISDVYLEEFAIALKGSDGDQEFASFAENHRFQIPEGCLWDDAPVLISRSTRFPSKSVITRSIAILTVASSI